ncbi:hypothetical protein FSP39_002358 [Pinctada imbricata]|uniref:Uncharacterized protein n=1 Tax=Pinctada imbricata TaxID=66713 RepID=A0AA88XPA6_PINIB|nr:hypothetical protein FSP39_002358 [Pinctada imbricata]
MEDYPIIVFATQLRDDHVQSIENVARLAEQHQWQDLIKVLRDRYDLINMCSLPKDQSDLPNLTLLTPLHHAVIGKAPKEVFEELLKLHASRTYKNKEGLTAYDIGKSNGLDEDILKMIEIPEEIRKQEIEIKNMEEGLHKLILDRVEHLIQETGIQLPQLSYLFEFGSFLYHVPLMYGSFSVKKAKKDKGIMVESWSRIVGGSGQRHRINKKGKIKLKAEGFM